MSTVLTFPNPAVAQSDAAQLATRASVEVERAQTALVLTPEDYDREAGEMVRLAELIKEAKARFDPICQQTDLAHKEACKQRNLVINPLERAKEILSAKVAGFLEAQRRAAEEEQRAALVRAQHQAELDREADLEHLERTGASAEEVKAVCERPLDPMPVIRGPAFRPGPVIPRDNYKGRVTDLLALVQHVAKHPEHLALLCPDETAINLLAKALKKTLSIPGIEVYNDIGTTTLTQRAGAPRRGATR